jgi:CheY-like chemotaxis protein
VRMMRHEFGPQVALSCEFGPLPPVVGDAARLGQLFVNLLANAAQASAEAGGGKVRVSTRSEPGGRVIVEIDDEGKGIAPELLGRVFDPFFTTRPVGQGPGLGRSVCHGIVTSMGGEIAVERREPQGTRVRITLPAARRPGPAPRRHAPPAPAPPRRGRVLVIDDDPHVGRSMARLLGSDHEVVALTDPREALASLKAGAAYDVVFCDLMMPHLTGMDIDASLRDADPPMPLVFMTAGAFTEAARSFVESCERHCLDKPIDPLALRKLVNEILRSGPQATWRSPPRRPRAIGTR